MNDNTIKRYSLSKQVADRLEKVIESGKYNIGDKIPTEVELMEIFNVSRNTIREAVRSLTSSGILEVRQGDGTYVKFNNRFNGYMSSKCEEVSENDIHEARNALEIAIARLAAERRTDEDIKNITTAYLERKELKSDLKENTRADIQFHMAIAEACHNKLMYDLYQSISTFIETHILQRHEETSMNTEVIDDLHEQLYNAIKEKDSQKAGVCAENILTI